MADAQVKVVTADDIREKYTLASDAETSKYFEEVNAGQGISDNKLVQVGGLVYKPNSAKATKTEGDK